MFSERSQSKAGQLEVLFPERDTDDGNAKHKAEYQMRETDPYSSQQNPKDVHDDA